LKAHNIIISANQIPLLASTFPPFSSKITTSHHVSTIFFQLNSPFPTPKVPFFPQELRRFRRQDRLMLHSYGDSELVCGLDAAGTGGAWRSPRGMLAITKHHGWREFPENGEHTRPGKLTV